MYAIFFYQVAVGPDHSPTGSQSLKTDPSPGIFDKDDTSDGSSSTYSSQRSIEKTKQRKDDIKKILGTMMFFLNDIVSIIILFQTF